MLALLLTRTTFNMFAMIAFIMLMGLVVKNGILLVDFANQARREERQIDHRGAGGGRAHPPATDPDDHCRDGVRHVADGAGAGGAATAPWAAQSSAAY